MLTKEQVKHVANLAKLKIDDTEAENYSAELSKVLGYIDQLNEVETGNRQVDVDVSGAINRWREDKPELWDEEERQIALNQAEVLNSGLVKVPRIM